MSGKSIEGLIETCPATHPVVCGILGIVRCAEPPGHTGDHVVVDGTDTQGNEVEWARWPQDHLCAWCPETGRVKAS